MEVSELQKALSYMPETAEVYIENPDRTEDYFLDHLKLSDDGTKVFIETAE